VNRLCLSPSSSQGLIAPDSDIFLRRKYTPSTVLGFSFEKQLSYIFCSAKGQITGSMSPFFLSFCVLGSNGIGKVMPQTNLKNENNITQSAKNGTLLKYGKNSLYLLVHKFPVILK